MLPFYGPIAILSSLWTTTAALLTPGNPITVTTSPFDDDRFRIADAYHFASKLADHNAEIIRSTLSNTCSKTLHEKESREN